MFALIGAFSNAFRGGQFKTKTSPDIVNAIIFGLCSVAASFQPFFFLQSTLMFLGSSWGWGAYITAIGKGLTALNQMIEQPFIDRFITRWCTLDKQQTWGFWGLTIRGLIWGICLAIMPAILQYWYSAAAFILAGLSMGLVYKATINWGLKRDAPIILGNGWACSEWAFGAVLFTPLDIMLLEACKVI